MNSNEIKKAIYDKGYDIKMIAEVLGKSPSLISKVLNKKARSIEVAEAISRILGEDISKVFPNDYKYSRGSIRTDLDSYRAKKNELKQILNRD